MTLNTVSFFPPKSRNVASASPIGIWIHMDSTMITKLLRNAIQKLESAINVFQLLIPMNFFAAEIPFH